MRDLDAVASRHDLSRDAVQALADALERGGGRAAQWNHPDLGGMGQWFVGGMLQIGAMFDGALKARVGAALEDLTRLQESAARPEAPSANAPLNASGWWPEHLGMPAATGSQNAMHYACFPDQHRLAVRRAGVVTVYDSGLHRLSGVAQSQGGGLQHLVFSGPDGSIALEALTPLA